MTEIVLQFSSSTAWVSGLIRVMCHSAFSHIDLIMPDGNLLGASDQGPKSPFIEGNPQGVAIRPPNYQQFNIRRIARLNVSLEEAEKIYDLARGQLGKGFDSDGLKEFLSDDPFDRDWRMDDHWFCAELLAWILEQSNFFPYPLIVPKNRITPSDLLQLIWPYMMNRPSFWLPPEGIEFGPHEIRELKGASREKLAMMFAKEGV